MKYQTDGLLLKKLLLMGMLLWFGSAAFGQSVDIEPNNICLQAQEIGGISLPFTLSGSLDTPPDSPDVDFFRFNEIPGTLLQIDLEGAATGLGTLSDPYLGLFDSACNLLDISDDNGGTLNSQLNFAVPADGVFILAVSSCCDGDFTGAGNSSGSYQLTIASPPPAISSISGQLIDAGSGVPIPGDNIPFAFVQLLRCDDSGSCVELVNSQPADSIGGFRFETDFFGNFIPPGTYQVVAAAPGFEQNQTAPLAVAEGEDLDIGVLALVALPSIGSISGRLSDADSGAPLTGDFPTFASVQLLRCDDFGCFQLLNVLTTDSAGQFLFTQDFFGSPLLVGTYQVISFALNYEQGQTLPFEVGEGENVDLGDIALLAIPVIGSISGQLIDAVTGAPLAGDVPPFATVQLLRCDDFGCFESVNFLTADSNGHFLIDRDFSGIPLAAGTYQLEASASDYDLNRSDPFTVAEGEHLDIGVIVLSPPPVQLSDIQPCTDIPAVGGKCHYSVTLTNRSAANIKGQAWSLVNAFSTGSRFGSTMFQTRDVEQFRLAPSQSEAVHFEFRVPEKVAAGAFICADVWIGEKPGALFDTLAQLPLFCILKEFSGAFKVMPQAEVQNIMKQSRLQLPQPSSPAVRKGQLLRQLGN